MILFKKTAVLSAYLSQVVNNGKSIGFVPTMGALHAGHISLLAAARLQNQLSVVSIFVNPAQFNDSKDFEKYPVTIEKDIALLTEAGCNILFLPSAEEIYPHGYNQSELYKLGYLETILEGEYRPGHFQGVCKVMSRLLQLVQPDDLYMGQKDYQQCMVVKRLLNIMQLKTRLHTCPILREEDGLAMSSRNTRLHTAERKNATGISVTLNYIKENIRPGDLSGLISDGITRLTSHGFSVDYLAIADANTLELTTSWNGVQKIIALVAAFQNEVRLIDNMLLN